MNVRHPPISTMSISRTIVLPFEDRETHGAADDNSQTKAPATVLTFIEILLFLGPLVTQIVDVISHKTSDSSYDVDFHMCVICMVVAV